MKLDDIEQHAPKQVNIGLILGLFCAVILVTFVLAYFFIDFDGKHLSFRHRHAHPTSKLVLPQTDRLGLQSKLS